MPQQDEPPMGYGIEEHQHREAAWAAGRSTSASVRICGFTVKRGRDILEACGFNADFSQPEQLPAPHAIDTQHRKWRTAVIEAAKKQGLPFTHGVAAKLVNCYLKSRFVCGGHHTNTRVQSLHPPIDAVLLESLVKHDVGGYWKEWRRAARRNSKTTAWTNFDSADYERVICLIRLSLNGEPLWKVEEYWQGYQ